MSVKAVVFAGVVCAFVAGAVLALTGGTGTSSFASRADSICQNTQRTLAAQRTSPTSIEQAMQIEHGLLTSYGQELGQLGALSPPASVAGSYRAGLADDRSLLRGLRSMIERPDYVELAITLPGHPDLEPAWLKEWLAREHALLLDAQARFSQAGVPACEKSLG